MKRAILIATGTLGGLGAVLAITPPHFGASTLMKNTLAVPATGKTATAAPVATTPTPVATTPAPVKATHNPTHNPTHKPKPAAPVARSFLGTAVQNRYGVVQVKITVKNGKITAARGVQMPNRDGQSASISQQAQVYLIQETLAAQSANIQGVSGASYTSLSWQQSLASAIAKAGL